MMKLSLMKPVCKNCSQRFDHFYLLPISNSQTCFFPLDVHVTKTRGVMNGKGTTVQTRFHVPSGFERKPVDENSFAFYLRNLPLKVFETKVRYCNGKTKDDRA